MAKKKKRSGKGIKKLVKRGKGVVRKVLRDPLVKEYMKKQKELSETTLKKAINRAEKKIESKI